ncbi:TMEM175 family protein [Candidatus Enterococcus clewellii]|uniref:Integral membrane protein n=1 Tax=Candidatus Enterococcus clewellii TaxID=1834193 RepID=A0AAQ3VTB9_9ENTE
MKSRIEASSDAVIAIVVTILVLEFKSPDSPDIRLVFDEWQSFLVYVVSFLLIFITWYDHYLLFKLSEKMSKKIFWSNGIWLFFLSLIPFTTSFAGKFPTYRGASLLYLANTFLWVVSYIYLSYALAESNPVNAKRIKAIGFLNKQDFTIFVGGGLLSFIISWYFPIFTWIVLFFAGIFTIVFNRNGHATI